jgi:serine/threonine-protein kinase
MEPLVQAGVPAAVRELIASCAAKTPAQRPQGFAPIVTALEAQLAAMEAPPARARAPLARMVWIGAGLAALVVLAVVLYLLPSRGPHLAPRISTETGEMVLVPAGEFQYGKDKEPVSLQAFYIDRTEVTNAAYAMFCRVTNRHLPDGFHQDQPGYAVVNVSILDARDFAAWAHKRLPTSREWEKAARGTDGRKFPWGDQPEAGRANLGSRQPAPADAYQNGASPYGALQMAGNVWELVEQLTSPG